MTSIHRTLPDFDDPPVVETVLGVEFTPLDKWGIPHFGLFWHEIKAEYPRFEVQPPIGSLNVNDFDWPQIPVRCWFYDEPQTKLIQVQNSRFMYNWRKYVTNVGYPRYENSRAVFQSEWMRFCSFLNLNQIDPPNVQRCEISYVNHIEKGNGWETLADLPTVIPCLSSILSTNFLPVPDVAVLNIFYLMPDNQGRLNIQLIPAIRQDDGKEILQLLLTAQGQPTSSEIYDIIKWFDLAREYVIQSFVDFTSTKMHDLWKKKERT